MVTDSDKTYHETNSRYTRQMDMGESRNRLVGQRSLESDNRLGGGNKHCRIYWGKDNCRAVQALVRKHVCLADAFEQR